VAWARPDLDCLTLPAHPPPGSAGQLSAGGTAAAEHGGDLVERQPEQVVQAEGQPLGGGEGVEHDHQGAPDRVGVLGLCRRVGLPGVGYAGRLDAEFLASGGS